MESCSFETTFGANEIFLRLLVSACFFERSPECQFDIPSVDVLQVQIIFKNGLVYIVSHLHPKGARCFKNQSRSELAEYTVLLRLGLQLLKRLRCLVSFHFGFICLPLRFSLVLHGQRLCFFSQLGVLLCLGFFFNGTFCLSLSFSLVLHG